MGSIAGLVNRTEATVGFVAAFAGSILALVGMQFWFQSQYSLESAIQQSVATSGGVTNTAVELMAGEVLFSLMAAVGVYFVYRTLKSLEKGKGSVLSILSEAFSSRGTMKLATALGAAYAVVFAFLSGTLVYQPTVNFAKAYSVTNPGMYTAVCCGGFGSTPELEVYVSPGMHLAVQLLPLTILLMVLVPVLVALNLAVAIHSFRQRSMRTGGWVGSVGAFVGLLTGCPTCAGYFLLSAAGGLGVTAFTFVLDPYQTLFVAVSIPLLLGGPFLTAYGLKRGFAARCEVVREA